METVDLNVERKAKGERKTSPPVVSPPSIFQYADYRKFLNDFYENKKALNKGFSYRTFAAKAEIRSPSHFQMIVGGKRNLSHKTIPKFIRALGLKGKEAKYFEQLVLFNQAEDQDIKSQYFSELIKAKQKDPLHKLERERFSFLSKWYIVAIYTLIETKDFKSDSEWIVSQIQPKISQGQAHEAFEVLESLGMIKKDPTRGYVQVVGAWNTDDDTQAIAVYNYHRQMINLALQALKTQRLSRREMNGATISLPKDKLPLIKEKIRKFRAEILEFANTFQNSEDVYQLNIQLFPFTQEKL